MATTWTDHPVNKNVPIKARHMNELTTAIGNAGYTPPLGWTDHPVTVNTPIKARHFNERRQGIRQLWLSKGMGEPPNWTAGSPPSTSRPIMASDMNDLRHWFNQWETYDPPDPPPPLGLYGVNFFNASRNWRSKTGYVLALVYTEDATPGYSIPEGKTLVQQIAAAGLRPLLRVDFRPGQTIPRGTVAAYDPAANDEAGRSRYVTALLGIAADAGFASVFAYIVGNEMNTNAEAQQGGITPTWYSRVFNGAGAPPGDTGNAFQAIRTGNAGARVLVGPVGPWNVDQNADDPAYFYQPPPPRTASTEWENYFNEVIQKVFDATAIKGPFDGFAVHAYGRTGVDGTGNGGASEPLRDVIWQGPGFNGAQAGFRVCRNWMQIIDSRSSTIPIFITETNTRTDAPSSQSYPVAWLRNAYEEIVGNARIKALCWFTDKGSAGDPWATESLQLRQGKTADADDDFNWLLANTNY